MNDELDGGGLPPPPGWAPPGGNQPPPPPPPPSFGQVPPQQPGWGQAQPPPPGPGQPPPGYAPSWAPYGYGPPQQKTNGLAIASMVLGIVWCYWVGSLLAVIFGHLSLSQINKSNGAETGRGMAIAGLVLGYLGIAVFAVFMLVAATAPDSIFEGGINSDPSDGWCNEARYMQDPDC